MEKLNHLIMEAQNECDWKWIKAGKKGSEILHLLFADDILLFGETSINKDLDISKCLKMSCDMSGLKVNVSEDVKVNM